MTKFVHARAKSRVRVCVWRCLHTSLFLLILCSHERWPTGAVIKRLCACSKHICQCGRVGVSASTCYCGWVGVLASTPVGVDGCVGKYVLVWAGGVSALG